MMESYTVKSLILLIIGGALAGNYALEKLMGAAPVFGLSRKEKALPALGIGVLVVMLLTAPLLRAVHTAFLAPANLLYLQNLCFTALILCVAYLVSLLAKAVLKKPLGPYFLILAVNSAVFGLAVNVITDGLSLTATILTAFGVGLGYLFTLFVLAGVREKVDDFYVPKAFRGLPVQLLAAAIISMALLGFK
ncbi:MAG: hypothetical protein IJ237_08525 [Oscillospiraceae bacterium]|nr:hypothetical protein [Oscillospiraceae bacterium]